MGVVIADGAVNYLSPSRARSAVRLDTVARRSQKRPKLPWEGVLFDPVGISNFVDTDKRKFAFSLSKTVRSRALSNITQSDLPAKVQLAYKFGTLWTEGWKSVMQARLSASVRLLNLSGPGSSANSGHLMLKWSTRSDKSKKYKWGYQTYGWEIVRKVPILPTLDTRLFGRVAHSTSSGNNGRWRLKSLFGIEQPVKVLGFTVNLRAGMSPEGEIMADIQI
mmetsp:Transcript_11834/g.25672  ORF Transcript_11834/g.25672 Transcript_11834/m.25672 type:complete len:221 (+) Transcript_11834:58-720(+)